MPRSSWAGHLRALHGALRASTSVKSRDMDLSRSEQGTAAALVALGAFQTALAIGAPWGEGLRRLESRHVASPPARDQWRGCVELRHGDGPRTRRSWLSGGPDARFHDVECAHGHGNTRQRRITLPCGASRMDTGDGSDDGSGVAFTHPACVRSLCSARERLRSSQASRAPREISDEEPCSGTPQVRPSTAFWRPAGPVRMCVPGRESCTAPKRLSPGQYGQS